MCILPQLQYSLFCILHKSSILEVNIIPKKMYREAVKKKSLVAQQSATDSLVLSSGKSSELGPPFHIEKKSPASSKQMTAGSPGSNPRSMGSVDKKHRVSLEWNCLLVKQQNQAQAQHHHHPIHRNTLDFSKSFLSSPNTGVERLSYQGSDLSTSLGVVIVLVRLDAIRPHSSSLPSRMKQCSKQSLKMFCSEERFSCTCIS